MNIRRGKEIKMGYRGKDFISAGKVSDSRCFHVNGYEGIVGKQAKPLAVDLASDNNILRRNDYLDRPAKDIGYLSIIFRQLFNRSRMFLKIKR